MNSNLKLKIRWLQKRSREESLIIIWLKVCGVAVHRTRLRIPKNKASIVVESGLSCIFNRTSSELVLRVMKLNYVKKIVFI